MEIDVETDNLVDMLIEEDYLLWTDEDGKMILDKEGNLIVYKSGDGTLISIPNTEAFRNLYEIDIPEQNSPITRNPPLQDESMSKEEFFKKFNHSNFKRVDSGNRSYVWRGRHLSTLNCLKATSTLIKLVSSPKYVGLFKSGDLTKLEVWGQIAEELQANGFNIAANSKQATFKVFQKWRNLERDNNRYLKSNQIGKEKPQFFDEMNVILSKLDKSHKSDGDAEPKTLKLSSGMVTVFLKLLASDKYDKLRKQNRSVWNKLYEDLTELGYKLPGENKAEKVQKLFQKWRNMKRLAMRHHHNKLVRRNTRQPKNFILTMYIISKEMKHKAVRKQSGTQDIVDAVNPFSCIAAAQLDHDYEGISANQETDLNPLQSVETTFITSKMETVVPDTSFSLSTASISQPETAISLMPTQETLFSLSTTPDTSVSLPDDQETSISLPTSEETLFSLSTTPDTSIPFPVAQKAPVSLTTQQKTPFLYSTSQETSILFPSVQENSITALETLISCPIVKKNSKSKLDSSTCTNLILPENLNNGVVSESTDSNPDTSLFPDIFDSERICKPVYSNNENFCQVNNFNNPNLSQRTPGPNNFNNENIPKPNDNRNGDTSIEVLKQIKYIQEQALVNQQQNFAKLITLLEKQICNQNVLNEMFFKFVTQKSDKSKRNTKIIK